jgi:PAS domain S-box-containing protein
VITTDTAGRVTSLNAVAESLTGWTREEANGQPLHAVFCILNEQSRKAVENPAMRALREGQIVGIANHTVLIARDGTERAIDDSAAPIRDEQGKVLGVVLIFRDVGQRRQAERAVAESERRLTAELEATTRLHALSARLLSADDLTTALQDVLENAIVTVGADFGNIQLYKAQTEALEIVVHQGFRQGFLDYFRTVRVDEGSACAQAMRTGQRIVIEDVERDSSFEPHRRVAAAAGFRAVQSTPLKSRKDSVLGMLSTHFRSPHRPSERDERLLDLYARHAADLIERLNSDEALRRSEAQFRQLADSLAQIVWTARPDGGIDYLNRRWAEFTGLPQTVSNDAWRQILHADDARSANQRWAASLESGSPFDGEVRLLDRRQQSYRWHLIRTVPVKDEQGRVIRWFGTSTDIHEQKRAEESARFLAQASAELAVVVNYESTLQKIVNLAVPHFADWSAVDLADKDSCLRRLAVAHQDHDKIALVHRLMQEYPPDPQSSGGAFAVLRSGKPELVCEIPDELLVQGARDERHLSLIRSLGLVSYICVPLVVSSTPLGVLTFATAESGRRYTDTDLALAMDLAQRAAVAIENTQLYQALRDADRRKDEFLAMLAHELRNPLAPIRSSLQILKMPGLDAATVERTQGMMERQVQHLVRLVDDLLDVSRVMRGKITLHRERVELATIVARAVETAQPLIEAQGHELIIGLPDESLPLEGDPVRLAQVVGNLLTNAAKYTEPKGSIWLTAQREGGEAVLRVRDTGIGIAPDMLPRIFDLFVQVDHAATRSQGGLGIGLTLVKKLVAMHGGTVEARSAGLKKGSEFVVRLPLSTRRQEPPSDDRLRQCDLPSGLRLLVVDDNQDAADSLALLLRLQGHEVRVAHGGPAALEVLKSYRPEMIFLDIGMPGMDGCEVARRLRQTPGLETVVLVALTGWGQQEDRRRTAEAGFDHHLVKPPEPQALENLLIGRKRRDVRQAEA